TSPKGRGEWCPRIDRMGKKRKGRWARRHRPSLAAAGSRGPVPLQFHIASLMRRWLTKSQQEAVNWITSVRSDERCCHPAFRTLRQRSLQICQGGIGRNSATSVSRYGTPKE